jgi:BlaI family transcriptional regulator, penicillinase repressor
MTQQKPISDLGPLEFSLLNLFWERGASTAGDILQAYNKKQKARPLAYTTVATLLARMADKAILKVDKSRQPYLFEPLVSRDQLVRQRVRDFVQTFFPGQPIDLAVRLVEDHPLGEESLDHLEEVLKRHKKNLKKGARKSKV